MLILRIVMKFRIEYNCILFYLLQFNLIKSDKEQYDREERAETQQEILKRAAKDLPVYTRTASGGKLILQ